MTTPAPVSNALLAIAAARSGDDALALHYLRELIDECHAGDEAWEPAGAAQVDLLERERSWAACWESR